MLNNTFVEVKFIFVITTNIFGVRFTCVCVATTNDYVDITEKVFAVLTNTDFVAQY